MATLELRGVTVRRGDAPALDAIDLVVGDGELVGVVGVSGAGKTTLLRVVAGIDAVDHGSILLDGTDVTSLEAASRGVAMVHQQAVLIPRRTVRRNVAFPLEVRHVPPDEIHVRVDAESRAMHIEALLGRSPDELSAGETQLVQIARAMVRVPSLLLLDEPLAHLDPTVRARLRVELRLLQRGYGVTTLLATNEPTEAMSMPDRLLVLSGGRIIQQGAPVDVYAEPVDLTTAALTGEIATLPMRVTSDTTGFWLVHPGLRVRAWRPELARVAGSTVTMGVRSDGFAIDPNGDVEATVVAVEAGGPSARVHCDVGGDRVEVMAGGWSPHVGDRVRLRLDAYLVFDPVTGARLA